MLGVTLDEPSMVNGWTGGHLSGIPENTTVKCQQSNQGQLHLIRNVLLEKILLSNKAGKPINPSNWQTKRIFLSCIAIIQLQN